MLFRSGGDKRLGARVRLVEPSGFTKVSALGVEEQRVYVVADFVDAFDRRPTLGDSYRVEARIPLSFVGLTSGSRPSMAAAPAGPAFPPRVSRKAATFSLRRRASTTC